MKIKVAQRVTRNPGACALGSPRISALIRGKVLHKKIDDLRHLVENVSYDTGRPEKGELFKLLVDDGLQDQQTPFFVGQCCS
jgi:hypothetical protein